MTAIVHSGASLRVTTVDFENYWGTVSTNISSILRAPMRRPPQPFPDLYAMVYRLATGIPNRRLRSMENVAPPPTSDIAPQVYDLLVLLEGLLQRHITEEVAPVCAVNDSEIISTYVMYWEAFVLALRLTGHIFGYVHKLWTKHLGPHQPYMQSTWTVGLKVWRESLFAHVKDRVIKRVLTMIQWDRDAVGVDKSLIKRTLQSLVVQVQVDSKRPLAFYATQFETAFITQTEIYYKAAAERWLQECSVAEYMVRAEQRIRLELKHLGEYLDRSTGPQLKRRVVALLVEEHADKLLAECVGWLDLRQFGELKRLFWLLGHSEMGLEPLRKIIEDRIDSDGRAEIEKLPLDAQKDAVTLIRTVFKVYDKYAVIVNKVFEDNKQLQFALEKGCQRFFNHNGSNPNNSCRSAEQLARYCHAILKDGENCREDKIDGEIRIVVTLFLLLEDRDVFQQVYASLLCHRLLFNTFDKDHEMQFLGKLHEATSQEYTYKWQRMIADATEKAASLRSGLDMASIKLPFEFAPFILTHGSWPISMVGPAAAAVPPFLEPVHRAFEGFYGRNNQGRRLQWVPALSHGVVKVLRLPRAPRLEILVSSWQTAFLLQLNDANSVVAATIPTGADDPMNKAVLSLLRTKLIAQSEDGLSYSVNTVFTCNQKRINLLPLRDTFEQAPEQVFTSVKTGDRKYAVQAAIVRVLKSRKSMRHQDLVAEVVRVLAARFQPTVQDVKQNIEILIEKEYMERSPEDSSTYNYIA